jgi:hypothetical protein
MTNRITSNGASDPSVGVSTSVNALRLQRTEFVSLLRMALFHLNEDRLRAAGTPDAPEMLRRVRYWDIVLGWLKEQSGTYVDFVERP